MAKNAIVGQSGGPTSVINASLAGVYESCKRRGAGKVYGMLHGVAGLLVPAVISCPTGTPPRARESTSGCSRF